MANRRRKNRSPELLRAIRYERAIAYQALGRKAKARGELEAIYAEDPDHGEVRKLLGLDH